MIELSIIVPTHDNDGIDLTEEVAQFERDLCRAFGGYTVAECTGAWVLGDKTFKDSNLRYTVAVESLELIAHFIVLAHEAKEAFKQEAIYVSLGTHSELI